MNCSYEVNLQVNGENNCGFFKLQIPFAMNMGPGPVLISCSSCVKTYWSIWFVMILQIGCLGLSLCYVL